MDARAEFLNRVHARGRQIAENCSHALIREMRRTVGDEIAGAETARFYMGRQLLVWWSSDEGLLHQCIWRRLPVPYRIFDSPGQLE